MIKSLVFGLVIVLQAACLPSAFDIRYQPRIVPYGNFDTSPDYICESYTWGKQLAQVISNAASVQQKQKIVLSTQHIAECTRSENDKCK